MRILKLHNRQRLSGGVDQHMAWQATELTRLGHTVDLRYIDNRETQQISRLPRRAARHLEPVGRDDGR